MHNNKFRSVFGCFLFFLFGFCKATEYLYFTCIFLGVLCVISFGNSVFFNARNFFWGRWVCVCVCAFSASCVMCITLVYFVCIEMC